VSTRFKESPVAFEHADEGICISPGQESPPFVEVSFPGQLDADADLSVSYGYESLSVLATQPELGDDFWQSLELNGSGEGVQSLKLVDEFDGVMRITSVDLDEDERDMDSPSMRSRAPEPSLLAAKGIILHDIDRRRGS
jgi:hypothetical protein